MGSEGYAGRMVNGKRTSLRRAGNTGEWKAQANGGMVHWAFALPSLTLWVRLMVAKFLGGCAPCSNTLHDLF
jgi:hypothetical protein